MPYLAPPALQCRETVFEKSDLADSNARCQLLEAGWTAKGDKGAQEVVVVCCEGAIELLYHRHHEVVKKLDLATLHESIEDAFVEEALEWEHAQGVLSRRLVRTSG